MNKQVLRVIVNCVLILAVAFVGVGFMPSYKKQAQAFTGGLIRLSSPEEIKREAKTKFSNYIRDESTNNTTVPVVKPKTVMKSISAKDSDGYQNLTETPEDVAKLMKAAEKNYKKENSKGKTSEEPYLGGGTVIQFKGVEIQSKIPSEVYKPDIEALLKDGADLKLKDKSKPTVLIYHSHTTEGYSLLDTGYYMSSDARSHKPDRNVVRVGDELVKQLERQGFSVIHDTVIHDEDYNKSYDHSRKYVEKYLEEYPSIEVTIDLHRDDITYKNKTKVKPTAEINNKKAAKMMIIAGCEYGLVKDYPDWEYNLRFDLAVQQKVNELYKGVMRPILFSQRKYNMYETHNSFLLEIGTDANTLDEACYSARLFGDALGKLLNEKYVDRGK